MIGNYFYTYTWQDDMAAELARYRDALRRIKALADEDWPGFHATPDYWLGVRLCGDIAREVLPDEAEG